MIHLTARPLSRSKLLWFGVFTLCFLGWAWWDSYHASIYGAWTGGKPDLQLYRYDGTSILASGPSTYANPSGVRWSLERVASKPLQLEEYLEGRSAYGVRFWRLRDATVFFTVLGLWVACLSWRQRRLVHLRQGRKISDK